MLENEAVFSAATLAAQPLSELFVDVPESMKQWELTTGNLCRKQFIWEPRRRMIAGHLAVLRELAGCTARPAR